ncbi:bifunctional tRNA pseudouridine(32) synthase/23S rRNA pseudouridine(746) synthase RluA [Flocculibacter collagenilyticus]|uniref:bifunctional tRNA pseudouridine(32) synthase/23S rRNA pseudouridine(746) synthase RluA n=1 Tax=Flocculibacter collagenilyticus TaxID=2744479 RepID=UPI0018F5A605|nr:bifunctional tRNA pseudouridine(32) synthase/23S rRNA pseudouridine(746) synthase RluA [Flocculibacter collagenilyticus]
MALLNYSPPTNPYLDVVYHDDDIVVLNKPSGLLSVPGKHEDHKDCLETRVRKVWPTATIVHRLDMATSGILIMALNKAAHRHISRQFQDRLTEKQYIARVFGEFEQPTGEVNLPLICDWPNRPKQMVDFERGKPSLTKYKVLEQTSVMQEHSGKQHTVSRVALTPVTGRSHQLRVHMLSLDHPILGDKLYAHSEALALASRLQLHAHWLKLTHPVTEKSIEFRIVCPF